MKPNPGYFYKLGVIYVLCTIILSNDIFNNSKMLHLYSWYIFPYFLDGIYPGLKKPPLSLLSMHCKLQIEGPEIPPPFYRMGCYTPRLVSPFHCYSCIASYRSRGRSYPLIFKLLLEISLVCFYMPFAVHSDPDPQTRTWLTVRDIKPIYPDQNRPMPFVVQSDPNP